MWYAAALVPVLVVLGGVVALALLSAFSRRPDGLGVKDGRLAPCPDTPNCVCSQAADDAHRMEPIPFDGDPDAARARLKAVLARMPRTVVVEDRGDYLRAEAVSLVFRFIDDVEFLIDRDAKVIHFRSASRGGRSDLGVNRRRMEAIRAAFAAAP
jgi:uncharacterized protein (DUF1499 family)